MDKHHRLLIALGLALLASGLMTFIAFFDLAAEENLPLMHRVLTAMYSTLQFFRIEHSFLLEPERRNFSILFSVLRLICPALLIASGFALLAHLRREWESFYVLFLRKPILICGLGHVGSSIALYFKKQNRSVIGINLDSKTPNALKCRDAGVFVVSGDASDNVVLNRVRLHRASRILVSCLSDSESAKIAASIVSYLETRRGRDSHLRRYPQVFVHIRQPYLRYLLQDRECEKWTRSVPWVDYVSILEAAAIRMIKELGNRVFSGRVVISGLSEFTECLLLRLAAISQSRTDSSEQQPLIQVELIAPDANHYRQDFFSRYPNTDRFLHLIPSSGSLERFFSRSRLQDCNLSCAIICPNDMDDESRSLTEALRINKALSNQKGSSTVVVVLWSTFVASRLLLEQDSTCTSVRIIPFGILESFGQGEVLENTETDDIARRIWQDYVKNNPELISERISRGILKSNEWNDLSEEEKEKNRDSSRSTRRQLLSLGYELIPFGASQSAEPVLEHDFLEKLAEIEHKRWIKEKMSLGYSYGPVRIDEKPHLRHPSLVEYSLLPESEKQKDRDNWRTRLKVLAEMGYVIAEARLQPPSEHVSPNVSFPV